MRTPQETTDAIKQEYQAALHNLFPLDTNQRSLVLEKVHFGATPDHDDYNAQKEVVLKNGTWGTMVKGDFVLKDKDGNIVERAKGVSLGKLPTPTNRHTFIVAGREYSVANQRRSKAGIYTKIGKDGVPSAEFNLSKGANFSVTMTPDDGLFYLTFKLGGGKQVNVLAYPVLHDVFKMADTEITKYIPKDQLAANRSMGEAKGEDEIRNLAGALKNRYAKTTLDTHADRTKFLHDYFGETEMRAELNKMTVGHAFERVTGDALGRAMQLTHQIHKGEVTPTHRDHISFTSIHGVEDHLRERLEKSKRNIGYRITPKMTKKGISELGLSNVIGGHVTSFFTTNSLSRSGSQINVLEMAENVHKITPLGEGGIGDKMAVPDSARNVNPSYAGFIDPVRTPDNDKAGIDMRLSVNVKKDGKSISTMLINPKTGAKVRVKADELFDKYVGFDKELPDEHGLVRAVYRGSYVTIPQSKLDYLVPPDDQFTVSTTLVPFIQASHAHRSAMGAKMLNQALSLKDREAPIVDTIHSERVSDAMLPRSPVTGTVVSAANGVVIIKGDDGKKHKVNYANDFPLNGNSYLHTDLHVKVGDRVTAGQSLGDNTFTRGGKLALGTNMHVAYVPYKGFNYEDGIVVTESGAKKLTSQHMFTHEHQKDDRHVRSEKDQSMIEKYRIHFPGKLDPEFDQHLDHDGVVKPGTTLKEGDYIIVSMRRHEVSPHQALMGTFSKQHAQPMRDNSMTWDKPYPGLVTDVAKHGDTIKVTIKAHAPLEVGDKLAGRFGNKGVVVAIVPDHEAPKTQDGKVPDVMLNPAGIITRMNNGQIYETVASKALEHKGIQSHKFNHFLDPKQGNTFDQVKKLVKDSGVSPTDEFFDPKTGNSLGHILNGKQYMLKLEKQAEVGFSVRAFGDYDIDNRPTKGGDDGAKAIGTLDFYAFLAHDARNILREAATHKAEQNAEVFRALHMGMPLPTPKATYAYEKMLTMVKGMGLNVKKEGSKMKLLPMTDKDVLHLSSGEIDKPLLALADHVDENTGMPFRPEKGGLYDPQITGGLRGKNWSHITLAEPLINPAFAPVTRKLLGMKERDFNEYLAGNKEIEAEDGRKLTGGHAIHHLLSKIDPQQRMTELQNKLKETSSVSRRKDLYDQMKHVAPLAKAGLKPEEAFVINHVAVIPPAFRPIYPDAKTGKLVTADATTLYRNLMLLNNQMKEVDPDDHDGRNKLRSAVYDALVKVQGLDGNDAKEARDGKGFMKIVAGDKTAKDGFFQSKLLSRAQDIAGRGVAVPDPNLGIDEVGLPEPMAWKLYRPVVAGKLSQSGYSLKQSAEMIKRQDELARNVLQSVMQEHPVILSRAPSLHKFNVMAFKPVIVPGKSLRTNTLINKGFNLDHDGDAMNVHLPITPEAVQDAWKMLPSQNIFSPLHRNPVHEPAQEAILGLWKATNVTGAKPVRKFKTKEEAQAAFKRGEIKIDTPIEIG